MAEILLTPEQRQGLQAIAEGRPPRMGIGAARVLLDHKLVTIKGWTNPVWRITVAGRETLEASYE